MKNRLVSFAAGAAVLAALVGAGARAGNGQTPSRPAPAAASFTQARATWRQVLSDAADLDKTIRAGKLADVHEIAFAVRDNVVTLPYKSSGLSAGAKKKLDVQVRLVADIAVQLDKAGDANDVRATRLQQARLQQALRAVAALYPAGTLVSHAAAATVSATERALYLTPGGAYTSADIRANGNQTVSQKYPDFAAAHNDSPRPGDRICPITKTLANPRLTWVVGGKTYLFCCPPCVREFVSLAKKNPAAIQPPDAYVKK